MKLLAVDMDGTCLDHRNRFSRENMEALRRAAQAGVTVVPATGRTLSCLPHALQGQPFVRYVISSNGARVTDLVTGKTLFQALIPRRQALAMTRHFCEGRLGVTAHVENEYYVQGRGLYLLGRLAYGTDVRACICVKDLDALLEGQGPDAEELQIYFRGKEGRQATGAVLETLGEGCLWAWSDRYVEIFSERATKGEALKALCDHLGISRRDAACIGDSDNDLTMFAACGTSAAMGNAKENVKAAASFVTATNRENGVARVVDALLAVRPQEPA